MRLTTICLIVMLPLAAAGQQLDILLKLNEEQFLKRDPDVFATGSVTPQTDALREAIKSIEAAQSTRVWPHVQASSDREMVAKIRRALTDATPEDQSKLDLKPVQIVENGPRLSQLRYFKEGDAALAAKIAELIADAIGTPVKTVDMTAQFKGADWLQPGHLEFWAGRRN